MADPAALPSEPASTQIDAPAPAAAPAPADAGPAPQPAAPSTDWAAFIHQSRAADEQPLRAAVAGAVTTDPERAAKVQRYATQIGVPPEVVDRHFAEFEQQAKIRQTPYAQMLAQSPATAAYLAAPVHAAVVPPDDHGVLGALEYYFALPGRAVAQSLQEAKFGALSLQRMFGPLSTADADALNVARYYSGEGSGVDPSGSWFRHFVTANTQMIAGLLAPEARDTAIGFGVGAATGAVQGALAGPEAIGPTALARGAFGAKVGWDLGLARNAFLTSAGAAYDSYLTTPDEFGQPINPDAAKAAALAAGALNAALMLGGGAVLEGGVSAAAGKLMTRDVIAAALRQPTTRQALADLVKSYGTSLSVLTAFSVAQKAIEILGRKAVSGGGAAGAVSGQLTPGNIDLTAQPRVPNADGSISTVDSVSVGIDGKEVLLPRVTPDGRHLTTEQAVAEFTKTGRHLGMFDTPASADTFAQQLHADYAAGKYEPVHPAAALLEAAWQGIQSGALASLPIPLLGYAGDVARARRAEAGKAFWEAIGTHVDTHKDTIARLGDAGHAFVDQVTKDGPIATVYAPLEDWNTYWQSQKIDPKVMAATVTGDPTAYTHAVNHGGDLPIPTANYAAQLAGTAHNAHFAEQLRLGPDEMNAVDAERFKAEQTRVAAAPAETAPAPSPARRAIFEQLTRAGVPAAQAEHYAELADAVIPNLEQRTGLDLQSRYGISVTGPNTEPPAGGEPGSAPAALPGGVTPEPLPAGGAETGLAAPTAAFLAHGPDGPLYNVLGGPKDRSTVDAAGLEALGIPVPPTPVDTGERLSGDALRARQQIAFAVARPRAGAVEQRVAPGEPPGGVERRNAPIPALVDLTNIPAAAAQMRAENPNLDAEAAAMRARAFKSGRPGKEAVYIAPDATTGARQRADEGGGQPVRGVPPSRPRAGETSEGRATRRADHTAALVADYTSAARAIDPTVDPADLQAEIHFRLDAFQAGQDAYADSGKDPRDLLRAIAALGGISNQVEIGRAGLEGEVRRLKEGTKFGSLAGVAKVFKTGGQELDQLLEDLHQDPRFAFIENTNMLLDELDNAARTVAAPDQFPGTDELATTVGMDPTRDWWRSSWRPGVDMLAEGDALDVAGPVDTSFNVDEFDQSLFDLIDEERGRVEPPDPTVDTLTTGELQPRLPGDTGAVRDQNVATPAFEAPFALTSEVAQPKGAARAPAEPSDAYKAASAAANAASATFREVTRQYRAKAIDDATFLAARQAHDAATAAFDRAYDAEVAARPPTTLFQSGAPDDEQTLRAWAESVKLRAGPDLQGFSLRLTPNGDIFLESLIVDRGAQRAGVGSAAMRELTRYADLHGRRLTLTPAQPGDIGPGEPTSTGRLVKFYKRFGFVENKGRHRDFAIAEGMYRDPTEPQTLGQPFFHGSPHNFTRFSTEKIGTGEGAAAYGWGLYFAENASVASGYHERLAGAGEIQELKLGTLRANQANGFDYSRRAHVSDLENVRASLAEDLMLNEGELRARDPRTFALMVLDRKIHDYKTEWPEGAVAGEALRKELEKPGAIAATFSEAEGGVYRVDIGDEHIAKMLDWDAPIAEQPLAVRDLVRAALKQQKYLRPGDDGPRQLAAAFKAYTLEHGGMASGPTGETAYGMIVNGEIARAAEASGRTVADLHETGPRLASQRLQAAGVPGIRYLDAGSRDTGKGTRNVVVFDDAIITLTHKNGEPVTPEERKEFFQGPPAPGRPTQPRRGAIRFGPDNQINITLLEKADRSTVLHEFGHLFTHMMADAVDALKTVDPSTLTPAQGQVMADYAALLAHAGATSRETMTVEQHETLARSFEAYLMEGTAPSVALQSTFVRFRSWLLRVYSALKNLHVTLTPEVRQVFDRLVASDQAIAGVEAQRGVAPFFTTAADAGMSEPEFALYRQTLTDASAKARITLDQKLLTDVRRQQTADWKAQRAELETAVTTETQARPEYRALAAITRGTQPDGSPLLEGGAEPLQLNRADVGAERAKRLPAGVIAAEGGLSPDAAAELLGYASGDALLTALEQAPPIADVIRQETNRRMLEQHGSLILDGTLPEHAQAAVADASRDDVIRMEMRALGRKQRAVAPFAAFADRAARSQEQAERDYERRWFEAETKLRIAIAEGHKQVEIDALAKEVQTLKATARGGAVTVRAGIPSAEQLRGAALARIGATAVRDLRPEVFWSTARKADVQAFERAARRDFTGAITAKQQQLINLALFREATRAKDDVVTRVERAARLDRPGTRKTIGKAGGGFLDQIDGVLDRFGFSTADAGVLARNAAIEAWQTAKRADGVPMDLPPILLAGAWRKSYQDLSVDQFRDVTDALTQLEHLARAEGRTFKNDRDEAFQAERDGLVASIREQNPTRQAPIGFGKKENAALSVGDVFASHTKISILARLLDGSQDGGPMWESFIRRANEAADARQVRNVAAGQRLGTLFDEHYPGAERLTLSKRSAVPGVGSMAKEWAIAVALNSGTDTGLDRLLSDPSRKWTREQHQAILDTLDQRDWHFVQGLWKEINSYWDDIAAKQQRVVGVTPEKVLGRVIQTKFGEVPGAYYPLKYDGRLAARAVQLELAGVAQMQMGAAYVAATTQRGFTETRLEHVSLPVRLDLGVAFQHVGQVIHDLTHHEMLIDATRLLRDPRVSTAIFETKGPNVYRQFTSAFQDIATDLAPATDGLQRGANFLRSGMQIASLGLNLAVGLKHPAGIFNGAAYLGPKWMAKGVARWVGDAAHMTNTLGWIRENSVMMRDRGHTATQDLRDLSTDLKLEGGPFDTLVRTVTGDHVTQANLRNGLLMHIGIMQLAADVPTWIGGYEKAMDAARRAGGAIDETRAFRLADQAVLDSQGGGTIKDLAKVQRGGPYLRLFLTFYSYGARLFNSTAEAAGKTDFRSPASVIKFLGNLSLLYVLPAAANAAIRQASGKIKTGEDRGVAFLEDAGKDLLGAALNTMVGARELVGPLVYGRDYSGTAGTQFFNVIGAFVKQARQVATGGTDQLDEPLAKSVNDALGVLLHYPSAQVDRSVAGWEALRDGRTENPAAILSGGPPKP